jgi:hypothetical protein
MCEARVSEGVGCEVLCGFRAYGWGFAATNEARQLPISVSVFNLSKTD